MSFSDFRGIFETLLAGSVREDKQNEAVNEERMGVLKTVCEGIASVIGDDQKAELKLHPAFRSGGVSIKVPSVNLNKEQILKLKSVLEQCTTFEMLPLVSGKVEITATVSEVFNTTN